jgi:hypothetical protein
VLLSAASAGAQQHTQQMTPAPSWGPQRDTGVTAHSGDVASLDAILDAFYDAVSGSAGQERDWNRVRRLFIPHARIVPSRPRQSGEGAEVQVQDVEHWIERATPIMARSGFFVTEIGRTTETFGNIAHVFSAYDVRRAPQEAPVARGINSFQLLRDGNRWWIVTIFWDAERPDNQIPRRYRSAPSASPADENLPNRTPFR